VSAPLGKWSLALCATLLTLAFAEMTARLMWSPPQQVIISAAPDYAARLELEKEPARVDVPTRPEEAPNHFYRLTAAGRRMRANTLAHVENHVVSGRTVDIRTNSLGYRNREIGAKHGLRLLFLGDSITLAAYLDEPETFVRRIESLAAQNGLSWETINGGVAGISLKTELSILLETGLALAPDVVIVNFYLNDFQESLGVVMQRLPALVRHSRLLYQLVGSRYVESFDVTRIVQSAPSNEVQRQDGIITGTPSQYMRIYDRETARIDAWHSAYPAVASSSFAAEVETNFRDWGGAFAPEAWDYMRPLFDELVRLRSSHGFELRIVCHPVAAQVEAALVHDEPQQKLLGLCADLEVSCLDLLPALRRAHRARQKPLFYDNCHHTPEGSEFVAGEIYTFLAAP
jgi:hypothetical protein